MSNTEGERTMTIIRGEVDSLTLYEVTEDELINLENGPSSSIYLNFAISLITLSLSFFASIFTATFENSITLIVFLVIAIVSLLVGLGYFVTWKKTSKSYSSISNKIRARAEKKVVISNTPDEITVE